MLEPLNSNPYSRNVIPISLLVLAGYLWYGLTDILSSDELGSDDVRVCCRWPCNHYRLNLPQKLLTENELTPETVNMLS